MDKTSRKVVTTVGVVALAAVAGFAGASLKGGPAHGSSTSEATGGFLQ